MAEEGLYGAIVSLHYKKACLCQWVSDENIEKIHRKIGFMMEKPYQKIDR